MNANPMNRKYRAASASLVLISAFIPSAAHSQSKTMPTFEQLNNTHDIALSSWGPYSKKYAGISHIPNLSDGVRFDVTLVPGYYRSKSLVPNVLFESGYVPWDVDSHMTQFTYRYELEWKDQVVVDVTYTIVDEATVLVEMRCVNNTALPQNLALNLLANIVSPGVYPTTQIQTSAPSFWVNATSYKDLELTKKSPRFNLVTDGQLRGEVRGNDFIDGKAVAGGFGSEAGDGVVYDLEINEAQKKGDIRLYYRMKKDAKVTFRAEGIANQNIQLVGTGKFETVSLPYSLDNSPKRSLSLVSEGGAAVELNGLIVVPAGAAEPQISAAPTFNIQPKTTENATAKTLQLKYDTIPTFYGLTWEGKSSEVREVRNDELDVFLRRASQDHVSKILNGNGNGAYSDIFIRPVVLEPRSETTLYGLIATGTTDAVTKRLSELGTIKAQVKVQRQKAAVPSPILPQGQKYALSQKLLRATVLSDVVYPVYTQGQYIRHFTPGKNWDSLYTWDSGFIALGLREINTDLALQCLNAYTTPPGSQSAFIHHGSPVPTQMFAFLELWQKTQSPEMLAYFYPRLAQYYQFLSGSLGSSTTRNLNSNLIRTWDYFYNSGGWDDYPAQVAVHRQKLEQSATPVISTAQCIRVAKILRLAAKQLNLSSDVTNYDRDIAMFSGSLQKNSWDENAGYFSYVLHDKDKNPSGHLKDSNGQNYNQGLDGAYPLLSGICTPQQEKILLNKIFSPKHMWTPSGIGVVDQAAPYYREDGYWNGAVWMPHQWFMWKTMLDLGRSDLAFQIAEKGLDVYSGEANATYQTYEHFLAKTGRGAGWHQFSALSTPVLSWFSAYYKPGTVTTGFEIWPEKQAFTSDYSGFQATLAFDDATAPHERDLVVCLNPAHRYEVTFNGQKVAAKSLYSGLLNIHLPATNKTGQLIIKATPK
ncbi:glycoside hydrolase [bacterium]|nr:MAG: glycoside hydrolase [bacterium]